MNDNQDYPLTPEEFHDIYSRVPRLTVEVIIRSDKGVMLSLRDIEPYKGFWHLPGGTVLFGESLKDAVRRVAARELGVRVRGEPKFIEYIDYIEHPEHFKSSGQHCVGMAFLTEFEGELKPNQEAAKLDWFTELPENIHPDQIEFIKNKVL